MKYCSNCGQAANDNDQYCSKCGSPLPFNVEDQKEVQPNNSNIFAILGFVFSILFWPVGFGLSAYGLFLSRIRNGKGRGLAIAGLVISLISFIIYTVLVILKIAGVFDYWYAIFGE